jgi:N-acetylmuramoyl-L-alanine amidase
VLKAPDVPSILIETGFISNPSTERLLRSDVHQRQIARNIMLGVQQYFAGKPRRIFSVPINKPNVQSKVICYVVKKGDTLGGVATKYKISMAKLKLANKLKKDALFVNQKLMIPAK